jgi:Domain of unknown function (DUF6881)
MRHQRVIWHHDLDDEPVVLWSEIGDDGFERRKVDVYRDGRLDYADESTSTGTTVLGDQKVPSLEEIDAEGEFTATAVTRSEFDAIWRRATRLG